MEGVLAEGAELLEEEADEGVRDAGLIAAAQRVEHYEIRLRLRPHLRRDAR
jgi:ferritin-like metal-binding protein YciE